MGSAMSSFKKAVAQSFGRGTRVQLKKAIEVSYPTKKGVQHIVLQRGLMGVVTEILPHFTIRLDEVFEGKVREVRWHGSVRIKSELRIVDKEERKLWLVK
jgi:hypothetical protein